MKGTTIAAIATLGIFHVGMYCLKAAANSHAKKLAKEKAIENHTEEVKEVLNAAKKRCDIFKDNAAREKRMFDLKVKDWKIAENFDGRRNDILNQIEQDLEAFKESIGYSEGVEEANDTFTAAIEAFKSSISYDENKRMYEDAIKEAKSHYDCQKIAFDLASPDISDTTMKLRHAEEEAMNAKIKEAKAQLDALEKQLSEETNRLTQKKLNDIRSLDEKVAKEKIRLDKKSNKDLEQLNKELSDAQSKIQKDIRKARGDDVKDAISKHESDVSTIREQNELDSKAANDIFEAMPNNEKIAGFLKAHKVPKFVVAIVAVIPATAIGYLFVNYVSFATKIITAM